MDEIVVKERVCRWMNPKKATFGGNIGRREIGGWKFCWKLVLVLNIIEAISIWII